VGGAPGFGSRGPARKIDTGASTSSLHATDIETFERDGEQWVRFTAHLGTVVQLRHRRCEAPLVTMKTIKSSNGHAQVRYVISTTLALGDRVWRVQFTLACRKSMRYRLLLGSKALIDGQLVVNPASNTYKTSRCSRYLPPPQVLHEDRCAVAEPVCIPPAAWSKPVPNAAMKWW
jgi:hypothetical protein